MLIKQSVLLLIKERIFFLQNLMLSPGLEEAAQRILGRRTRVGRPMRIAGLPVSASGPAFATAVGLCLYAARPQDELWDFETPLAVSGRGRAARAVRWFRENW